MIFFIIQIKTFDLDNLEHLKIIQKKFCTKNSTIFLKNGISVTFSKDNLFLKKVKAISENKINLYLKF